MTTILRTPDAWPRPILGPVAAAGDPGDPADLEAAVGAGAFDGLRRAVRDLGPALTIATIAESGLRGRGGAGFPAAGKWRAVAAQADPVRCVVANGFDADPAVGTGRHLLETRPFAVLEGALIAALTVGASEVIVAIRAESAAAARTMSAAATAAEAAGFAGADVLGTGRAVAVSIRTVGGSSMLGEETVLLRALEGRRGQPEQQPPYTTERGLFDHPTLVHNVATLAAVPWIITNGADAWRAIGDSDAPGTVLVQVSGTVSNAGIAEIPTGTTITEIVRLAGGHASGPAKAYLVGGPSGGFLPRELGSTPYTWAALRDAGAQMGSGSIVVADETTCVVDLARLLTRYCADEACGKSIPCRIGLRRLYEIGQRVADGRARPTDLALIDDLGADIRGSALCDHERNAVGPLTTALRYFRSELDDHVTRGICPAGVCTPVGVAGATTARGR